ncbi:uncharacterized protein BJX67DRAFT_31259 [Aspergillus lucknowensis]|uniref:Endoplasmic reticulum junction formation protein lunapark n=1 Tax=Aspergillus lucknowensis TaxID=176173 RepID=A0ABR4LWY1_9EURO
MVSLWPFKGEDNSPASFEKALSTLSGKITRATSRLDLHRRHARRFKALWTLYTTFIYLLYSIILALVLGWQNWGVKEYAAIVGGPIVIYGVRAGGTKYYEYRINSTQRFLENLNKQRDETIEKLKVATKYNSTQELLEKYAGDSPKQPRPKDGDQKPKPDAKQKPSAEQQSPVQRTGIPPPPTANIRRTPQPATELPPSPYPPQQPQQPPLNAPLSPPSPPGIDEPGFAPNAFPASQQYIEHSRWYDRLLDVLLGEDETQPKNRIVLICSTCRLVNGQAPPGVKSLDELGRWRCGGCGAWNGEESAAKKALADIKAKSIIEPELVEPASDAEHRSSTSTGDGTDDGVMVAREGDQDQDPVESQSSSGAETPNEETQEPPAAPKTRSQARRRRSRKG